MGESHTDRRLKAGADRRIKRREEISRVFQQGRRATDRQVTLLAAPMVAGRSVPRRLAVAVAKRYGNAVVRNRAKRVCREAFRLVQHELPAGFDYVICPRGGVEPTTEGVRHSLIALSRRVTGDRRGGEAR
jgi:ribonuclease P protein component